MNDICVYSIWTYDKQILHDYYCQIVIHEICDELLFWQFLINKQYSKGGSIQCEFKTFIKALTKLFWLYMMKPCQT
jgi:hypothetical protein